MGKQLALSLLAAFVSLPFLFFVVDHLYLWRANAGLPFPDSSNILGGLVAGFFAAPFGAALVFILALFLLRNMDRDPDED